ncbi:MAG: hypothetical protein HFF43_03085 [Lawsonibacter sp.]|jgi:hypothetical protein|nr:hypothetical protein [Lawsonibacter sp.]
MELSREEQLAALGAALYLVGIEVEASREQLEKLYQRGVGLNEPETLSAYHQFNRLSWKFSQIEEHYLKMKGET